MRVGHGFSFGVFHYRFLGLFHLKEGHNNSNKPKEPKTETIFYFIYYISPSNENFLLLSNYVEYLCN